MSRAFLGLGSNVGNRQFELDRAVQRLASHPGVSVKRVAAYLETEPVGYLLQGKFLNTVVEIETTLSPHGLLELARGLEEEAKRTRTIRFGPRTLDVDILLYDDLVLNAPDLVIPHPRMRERGFVLLPLMEIAPETAVPPEGQTVAELLQQLKEKQVRI